jgi:serine/threonine protein phosphatase PrpC
MPLILATGHASAAGKRPRNEDFVGMVTPREPELSIKGVLAALADGVSGDQGGREAAEYAVRGLLSDYYATPDTWPVAQALERVLVATNSWIQHQGAMRPELAGMATTLTCVVLRGGFYHFAHVGDTRLYLLRAGTLTRLTTDHVWDRPEMQHVLTRAIGLDSRLAIDHGMGELQLRDVFLLASDGVWNALTHFDLTWHLSALALGQNDADTTAAALVRAALEAGSSDNASALALRIDALPEQDLRDALSALQHLPAPPRFKPGQEIDGYRIDSVLHNSRATLLYRVTDLHSGRALVLKTLQPERGNDPHERAAFAHEEWLAKRAVARFFAQVITPQQRSALYTLTTWHDGSTLQQLLDAQIHFTIPDVIAHGIKLVRAVGALHRRSILHRDIKPANCHLGLDGELRLLDFGVAQSGFDPQPSDAPMAGTPSYLAPEQFDGAAPARQTDLYAVGVTLYQLLTRHYPYGEIEAFQRPRFGQPTPPIRYRPEIPHWLENVVMKAISRDPADRFETAEEFLLALERGATRALAAAPPMPLLQRDAAAVWRGAALVLLVLNLLLIYLLVVR